MYYAILILLMTSGEIEQKADQWGPYNTEKEREERADAGVAYFTALPNVLAADGFCEAVGTSV